jgi:hypothetical protein
MPNNLIDTKPSDFETTLQDSDFVSKKAKLVTQEAELIRSLDKAPYKEMIKIQNEIFQLEEQIKQMDQERVDAIY